MSLKGKIALTGIPLFLIAIAAVIGIRKNHFTVEPVAVQTDTATYAENQKPGSTQWKKDLAFPPVVDSWKDDQQIYGYANLTSVNRGQTIELKVSTTKPSYSIQVYRIGWYGGQGARLMQTIPSLKGVHQEVLSENDWATSYELKTQPDWASGVYLAKLITNDSDVAFIVFVVRDDRAWADIVFQLPVATYQAYNNWGGKSLYDFNSIDGRAHAVSFNRPYATERGAGFFFDGDYNMIRWLESKGYEVTYITSTDVESNPNILKGRKVFLSDWHDEYWSKNMRNTVTSALGSGVNLAFFSANNMYQQIRFEDGLRTIVCYKDASLDPTTVQWRQEPVNQPENALLGVMYIGDFDWGDSSPWVVKNADHWIYAGTGLKNNDKIPGLVGYEYDAVWDNGSTPAGLEVLSASPVRGSTGAVTANSSIYTAPGGARVFSAGTIYWPWKLDDNDLVHRGADARVQRMTANILDAMIHGLFLSR